MFVVVDGVKLCLDYLDLGVYIMQILHYSGVVILAGLRPYFSKMNFVNLVHTVAWIDYVVELFENLLTLTFHACLQLYVLSICTKIPSTWVLIGNLIIALNCLVVVVSIICTCDIRDLLYKDTSNIFVKVSFYFFVRCANLGLDLKLVLRQNELVLLLTLTEWSHFLCSRVLLISDV